MALLTITDKRTGATATIHVPVWAEKGAMGTYLAWKAGKIPGEEAAARIRNYVAEAHRGFS